MKKRVIISLLFILFSSVSVFSMGQSPEGNRNNYHHGGGGVPEPATLLLIAGGVGAAYTIKRFIDKK